MAAIADLNFRLFNPEQGTAEEQGFYHGFPCHLGHTLRDQKNHWCHDCAKRIKSNVSGLDISFIHSDYRRRLVSILDMVRQTIDDDLDPTVCWDVGKSASARYNYPSYRSQTSRRKNDLIMLFAPTDLEPKILGRGSRKLRLDILWEGLLPCHNVDTTCHETGFATSE